MHISNVLNWHYIWVACRKKCIFKDLWQIVIRNEGLADMAPPILLLIWHQLYNIICEYCRLQMYCQCHTKGRIDGVPSANPSFGMITIFKDTFLQHMPHILWQDSITLIPWCDWCLDIVCSFIWNSVSYTVLKKRNFPPRNRPNNFSLSMWDNWYQEVLDFDHTEEILGLFRGRKFLFLTAVLYQHRISTLILRPPATQITVRPIYHVRQ